MIRTKYDLYYIMDLITDYCERDGFAMFKDKKDKWCIWFDNDATWKRLVICQKL